MANRKKITFTGHGAGLTNTSVPIRGIPFQSGLAGMQDMFIGNGAGTVKYSIAWIDLQNGISADLIATIPDLDADDAYLYYDVAGHTTRYEDLDGVFEKHWFEPSYTEGGLHTVFTNGRHLNYTGLLAEGGSLGGNYTPMAKNPNDGKWYFAYWTANSQFMIKRLDENHNVDAIWHLWEPRDKKNLHYHMSLCIDSNGYIHVFYDGHNSQIYYRRSTNPNDGSAWEAEHTMPGYTDGTYHLAGITQVSGSERLFIVGRKHDATYGQPTSLDTWYTDDLDGTPSSWTTQTIVEYEIASDIDKRSYPIGIAVDPTGSTWTVHFVWEWKEGTGSYTDVLYMRSEDGLSTWKKGDGTTQTLPANYAGGTNPGDVVHSEGNRGGRKLSIALDNNGDPVIPVLTEAGVLQTYEYSSGWVATTVDAPAVTPNDAHIKIVIDGDDDNNRAIFYDVQTGSIVYQYITQTTDGGANWTETLLSTGDGEVQSASCYHTDAVAGHSEYVILAKYNRYDGVCYKWPTAWTDGKLLGDEFYTDFMPDIDDSFSSPDEPGRVGIDEGKSVGVEGDYAITRYGRWNTSWQSGLSLSNKRFIFSFREDTPAVVNDKGYLALFSAWEGSRRNDIVLYQSASSPSTDHYLYRTGGNSLASTGVARDSNIHHCEMIIDSVDGSQLTLDGSVMGSDAAATSAITIIRMSDHSGADIEDWLPVAVGNIAWMPYDRDEPTGYSLGTEEAGVWFEPVVSGDAPTVRPMGLRMGVGF